MEHDFQLDTPAVANLSLQPSWIQHLCIERGPVNRQFCSGTLVRRILDLRQYFSLEKDPLTSRLWARGTVVNNGQ